MVREKVVRFFRKNPITANAISGFIVFSSGDLMSQIGVDGKSFNSSSSSSSLSSPYNAYNNNNNNNNPNNFSGNNNNDIVSGEIDYSRVIGAGIFGNSINM